MVDGRLGRQCYLEVAVGTAMLRQVTSAGTAARALPVSSLGLNMNPYSESTLLGWATPLIWFHVLHLICLK